MDAEIDEQVLSEAARWFARLRAPDCSTADREAFERWRDADPSHAAAYARAHHASGAVDELLARDPRVQAMLDEALLAPDMGEEVETHIAAAAGRRAPAVPSGAPISQAKSARRWTIPAALAASVLLAVSVVGVHRAQQDVEPVVYQTAAAGETIALQDGSRVQLDVGTRIAVRFTAGRRQIALEAGRALFDVAHDAARPFSVAAATSTTTALGTRFQIEMRDGAVLVTLAEGSVAVDNEGATQVWQERLHPGERLQIDLARATRDKQAVDLSVATSWSRGRLLFRDTPLADVVNEINRYAKKKVRLGDPSLAQLPVGGNFIAGDSDVVVDALAGVLPLRVVNGGDKEIILVRRYDGGQH
jgi:transmembrane sensor